MGYKFAKSTMSFYHTAVHTNIPADATYIADADYTELFEQLNNGKELSVNSKGKPIAVAPNTTMTKEDIAARLQRSMTGLLNSEARKDFFTSIDDACSYVEGDLASLSAMFRTMRQNVRASVVAVVDGLAETADVQVALDAEAEMLQVIADTRAAG